MKILYNKKAGSNIIPLEPDEKSISQNEPSAKKDSGKTIYIDILKTRLVKGEITKEEFNDLKKEVEN